jgi:hypothetical protein
MNATIPRLLLALGLAAAACGYKPAKVDSSAPKEPAYTFPHAIHVDADVACVECHGAVEKATRLDPAVRHVRIPQDASKRKECSDCHDTDPSSRLPARAREFRVRFSHADHLKRVSRCTACHRQLPEAGDAAPRTPPMEACTSCHVHQAEFAQARCMPCHVDLKGYRPESAFRHEGSWIASHGALARPSAESCAQCHDQTYCAACHASATAPTRLENLFPERVDRGFIHRGDYVSRHVIDAGANPASCRRCHGSGFCDACHALQGLSRTASGALRVPESHRVAGWSGPVGAQQRHRDAARRDISACAGCHDQGADATCVGCHRVGGFAGSKSPHPRKFLSKHDLGDVRDNAMCRACHG